jgi:membrane protein DedA with SNARE-associated domain
MITLGLSLSALATRYGYLGVAATMFVEGFGVPAPGETAIIAGARGRLGTADSTSS